MEFLYGNLLQLDVRMIIMWAIGGLLIYLAIKKDMEPSLLLPMGFGAILVNLPNSGAVTQGAEERRAGVCCTMPGIANELFPLLLFVGIGAMIDFGPLLGKPRKLLICRRGLAVRHLLHPERWRSLLRLPACTTRPPLPSSARRTAPPPSSSPSGTPASIWVPLWWPPTRYMALVPIIQPPVNQVCSPPKRSAPSICPTTQGQVSKTTRILFPIVVTVMAGLVAPRSAWRWWAF